MAGLIWFPMEVIAGIGIVLFFAHNAFDLVKLPADGTNGFLWKFLLTGAVVFKQLDSTHSILVLYTLLPWTGVMICGYVLGQVYRPSFNSVKRKRLLFASGAALILLFIILRAFNIYGDPSPWAVQDTTALSVISFFNVSKYPPSLLYLCMTIGPGLIVLSMIEKVNTAFTSILIIYGKVPFFYYILHFYLIRLFNIILFFAQGYTTLDIVTPNSIILFRPVPYGISLLGVYLVWLLVIAALYLPCRWFSNFKKLHHQWWLSYL